MDSSVVASMVDYGWWFPESGQEDLGGWDRSNVNVLTADGPPYSPEMGSTDLRGIRCRVEPIGQES